MDARTAPRQTAKSVLAVLAGVPLHQAAARIAVEPADLADAVAVYQAAGYAALEAQAATCGWYQVRIQFTDWNSAEHAAATHLSPQLQQAQDTGLLAAWWFIRKAPCWRLRCRPGPTATVADMQAAISTVLDSLTEAGLIDRWWETVYEPEACAFGGPQGTDIAHDLFHADSRGILDYLRRQDPTGSPEGTIGRRELSVLLCSTLSRSAGQEWHEHGDVWHRVAQMRPLPPDTPTDRLPDMAGGLRRLMTVDTDRHGTLLGTDGPLAFAAPWGRVRRGGPQIGRRGARRHATARPAGHPRVPRDLPLEPSRPGRQDTRHPRAGGTRHRDEPAEQSARRSPHGGLMYTEPDDPDVTARMRTAHSHVRTALDLLPDQDATEAWGWRGRTLSRPVIAGDGPAWLRVACAPTGQIIPTFWDGSLEAEKSIPRSVPRPRLRDSHDWSHGPWEYRAELYDRVATSPVATSPTLATAPDLPATWWATLRAALDDITAVPTHRYTVRQHYLDRAMPHFLGTPIDTTTPSWSTAHGDFHYANICAPTLLILDWEGWGLAPSSYDAAVLHSHSLLVSPVATRIRNELAHVLDTPTGRFAELVVITQLLHSTTRGDNLELAEPLRNRAALLLGCTVPLPTAR